MEMGTQEYSLYSGMKFIILKIVLVFYFIFAILTFMGSNGDDIHCHTFSHQFDVLLPCYWNLVLSRLLCLHTYTVPSKFSLEI